MIRILSITLAVATMLAFSPVVRAEDVPASPAGGAEAHEMGGKRHEMREKWEKMNPEERAAARAKMKERFDALPPEKQAAIKARRAEHHEERREHHRGHGDDAAPVAQ